MLLDHPILLWVSPENPKIMWKGGAVCGADFNGSRYSFQARQPADPVLHTGCPADVGMVIDYL